ncbi:MAG: hypothetical protein GY789_12545 [Hyphomicrobiales bacterium]|nr:hypothetical protein [Hyphomicrobiales bacterium]MCP5000679.1 hypothetical protein [Hyphomicrobiales bacterium]
MSPLTQKAFGPTIHDDGHAYIDAHGSCKIFAASDQEQFIDRLKRRYGDRVLSYEAIRTRGKRNPFELEDGKGYRKGEDVLIDCLLLSKCDYLLKCTSAVGEFAMYFNPDLECIDMNHQGRGGSKLALWAVRKKQEAYGRYLDRKRKAFERSDKK